MLVNEFRTSKCCCCQCGQVMSKIYVRRNKGKALEKPVMRHGMLRCETQDFCHRDKNAALDIMAVYEALAADLPRPAYLTPGKGS